MTENTTREIWRSSETVTDARVADLMARMTLPEKVGQLSALWLAMGGAAGEAAPYHTDIALDTDDCKEHLVRGVGQLTRPYGTAPVDPKEAARSLLRTQEEIMAAGRFGIPALVHEECLTGVAVWKGPVYPSPLCWGASFDPALIERLGENIGRLMSVLGVHQGLAPVLDVSRDLRWGRTEETIGEDPYLVGVIASAYVRGLESAGVMATLKHFVGHSASRAGRNMAPVSAGEREVADVFLPPFEMALRSGARSVMNSYTDLDGVPTAADADLLTDLLRDQYGFCGVVVSDYHSVRYLRELHGVATTDSEAAELALRAGIDVELPIVECYGDALIDAVVSGRLEETLVDRALERVLRQKCEVGLLDAGWSPSPPLLGDEGAIDNQQSRWLARQVAQRSAVLLSNDGMLPLRPGARVALVGPLADTGEAMLGDYSFPMHVARRFPSFGMGVEVPTLRQALAQDPACYDISYSQGCPVLGGDDEAIDEAARVAASADLCVAVLGDQAGLFGGGTSGEGCDATDLSLPGRQEELLERLLATSTPLVLVLLVGRPYDISRQVDRLAAALCAFFPGEEGAVAVADVLSGRVNPSGRLPVSFPARGGGMPGSYLGAPLAQLNALSSVDPTPLFSFGHGLSYAPAKWVSIERLSSAHWPTDSSAKVAVKLCNDSDLLTTEVIQVYLHDPVAEVSRPTRKLIGLARVELEPGVSRTVTFTLHADLTAYTGVARRRQVDPGEVQLLVGASSVDIRHVLNFELTGPRRQVGFERVMEPTVEID